MLFFFLHRCTFEQSLCRWNQLSDDDFDWTRNQGSTGSYGTGPMFDHTLGSSAGKMWLHHNVQIEDGDELLSNIVNGESC